MLERYKTILNRAEFELIEKKSRFIATATPIETEEQAQIFIEQIRKKYWDAAHNVFAYQIGDKNQIQRCSDDGEPSGTAGMPMLDVLKGEDIKNAVVVVTRYFGGTLLGTGGLVRAYGKTAKEGLIAAGIIEKILYQQFEVTIDYTLVGKVQYEILKQEHMIKDTLYTNQVTFIVLVELRNCEHFIETMIEVTSAKTNIIKSEILYGAWLDGKLILDQK
jgi:uncharacterized YigZ family protein